MKPNLVGLAAAIAAAIPRTALAQAIGQAVGDDLPWLRVIGSLAVCLLLAVAAAAALRWRAGGGLPSLKAPRRRLVMIESVRLSHQVNVSLLKVDGDELLIASGPQGGALLARLPPASQRPDLP